MSLQNEPVSAPFLRDLQSNVLLHEYNDALLHYDLLYHKNPAAMVFPDILQYEVHVLQLHRLLHSLPLKSEQLEHLAMIPFH